MLLKLKDGARYEATSRNISRSTAVVPASVIDQGPIDRHIWGQKPSEVALGMQDENSYLQFPSGPKLYVSSVERIERDIFRAQLERDFPIESAEAETLVQQTQDWKPL